MPAAPTFDVYPSSTAATSMVATGRKGIGFSTKTSAHDEVVEL
jgi:hypothetical protein